MAFVMGAALGAILGSFVTVVALALIWGGSDRGRQQQKGPWRFFATAPFSYPSNIPSGRKTLSTVSVLQYVQRVLPVGQHQ